MWAIVANASIGPQVASSPRCDHGRTRTRSVWIIPAIHRYNIGMPEISDALSATDYERRSANAYVGHCEDGINWAFIRAAQTSVASFSVTPLQDVLGLGSEARLNTPSVKSGNYLWRYQPGSLKHDLAERLANLAEVTDRLPQPVSVPPREEFAA